MNRMPHKETVTQSHVCCQPYRQAAFSVGRTRNMHVLHRDRDACQLPAIDDSARGNPATICMPVVFLCLSLSFAPIFTQARVFHGTATVDMRNYLGHFFAVVRPTPPPIVERSIVMRMSVCVCVCLCVCLSAIISSELHVRSSPNFWCMLPMALPSVLRHCWLGGRNWHLE